MRFQEWRREKARWFDFQECCNALKIKVKGTHVGYPLPFLHSKIRKEQIMHSLGQKLGQV